MFVDMNRCGRSKGSASGGVLAAMGASASRIRSGGVLGRIGPTPEEPTSVMERADARARLAPELGEDEDAVRAGHPVR
jgi:hypothetical protein